MAAFYHHYPEAEAVFETLSRGCRAQLEGQMIENSLYCLMRWFEAPGEIEIMLRDSVPHHHKTLQVPADWYLDLIEVAADVIADTIPAQNAVELEVWKNARCDLRTISSVRVENEDGLAGTAEAFDPPLPLYETRTNDEDTAEPLFAAYGQYTTAGPTAQIPAQARNSP